MYDCRYWLWLSYIFDHGSIKCDKLLKAFDFNPKAIYEADANDYAPFCEKSPRLAAALCDKRLDQVYKTLEFCEKNNVGILTYDDPKYPSSLRRIQGQPTVIYYKGTVPDFSNRLSIGVVGTRNVTPYGSSTAYTISHDLAAASAVVVSGMALGSDTAAHRGALDARGTTVAFLGCGINVVYPKENAYLMSEIIESGAVMTDYPPFSRPEGKHFPVRNRLISGVSDGVLVIEAAKKSGALITAQHAQTQGKILYAIPGRIGELTSEGTNSLLTEGAKTVTGARAILEDFSHLYEIKETENRSGFTQFKATRVNDLSVPYKTPVFSSAQANARPEPPKQYAITEPVSVNKALNEEENARAYMSMSSDDFQISYQNAPVQAPVEPKAEEKPSYEGLSETEIAILKAIDGKGRVSVDAISDIGIPVSEIISTITILEIKQRVVTHPGGYFEILKRKI